MPKPTTNLREGWGFAQEWGGSTHIAKASTDLLKACPQCGTPLAFRAGIPTTALSETEHICQCAACGHIFFWRLRFQLDLSAVYTAIKDKSGVNDARQACERLARYWGLRLGALTQRLPAPA